MAGIHSTRSGCSKPRAALVLDGATSRDEASTISPGNLFQCLSTVRVKKFFVVSNLRLLLVSNHFPLSCHYALLQTLPLHLSYRLSLGTGWLQLGHSYSSPGWTNPILWPFLTGITESHRITAELEGTLKDKESNSHNCIQGKKKLLLRSTHKI